MSVSGITADTLTDAQIRRLAFQAAVQDDEALAGACAMALSGDAEARRICADRLEADAAADIAAWEAANPDLIGQGRDLTPEQVLGVVRAAARKAGA